ncbi:hypothetical protein [Flavobacterium hungaricum]|uniref:Uncharacterized protein n=1 Tax=Flavobacterium hungaricum TaxID=2082725 RepID=A0ABR9TRU9_9FLAO|nr:hypothetical protein [Flavobacterium hungaricum]MBE8728100.1 hypothetical protein [Flavobacterium hungaricum]
MHLILYKINKDHQQLYDLIKNHIGAFENPVYYKTDSDDGLEYNVFEGSLNNEETIICFEGKINFIKLHIKYSQFLNHESYYERVINFEKALIELFNNDADLYRLDEILVEDLLLNKGIYWYRQNDANETFNQWIENEEKLHWLKMEIPYKELRFKDFWKERS